jgi:hypothetical protein
MKLGLQMSYSGTGTVAVGKVLRYDGGLFGLRASRVSTAAVLAILAERAAVLLLTPALAKTAPRAWRPGTAAQTET